MPPADNARGHLGLTNGCQMVQKGTGAPPTGRLAALRSPQFRLLMGAGMAMQLGQWIQRVALLWVVYDLTGSAVALGTIGFLSSIFVLVLSPLVGPLADRFGARRLLMLAAIGQATGAIVLAVAVFGDFASVPLLYTCAVGFGLGQAVNQPTRNLLVYDAVGRDLLRNGLALNGFTGNTMRVVGPSIGGLIVGLRGADLAFGIQAVLLTLAVFLVAGIHSPTRPGARLSPAAVTANIVDGFRHLRASRALLTSFTVATLVATFVYPYNQFMPVFVRENMHGTAWQQGVLYSGVGVGSLIGLWYVAAGRGGTRSMLWAGVGYMLLIATFEQMRNFYVAFAVLCTAGIVHSVFSTLNQALVQLNADEEYRARVMGSYSMVAGIEPFSILLLGPAIEHWGPAHAMGACAVFAALATLLLAVAATREARTPAAAT